MSYLGKLSLKVFVALSWTACQSTKAPEEPLRSKLHVETVAGQRIIAIGDLHGDLDKAQATLQLAGAIDGDNNWIGENLIVVQLGDQIDYWHQDRRVLDFMEDISTKATAQGGQLINLLGNHEVMNAHLDFRYSFSYP